ncbi:MAG: serine/threonine protein kinase [Nannocystaceae bacterium]|nr:serine/threonine protein kinase [Nannocystaceae bacterium]
MHPSTPSGGESDSAYQTTMAGEASDGYDPVATQAESLDRGAHLGRYTVLERIGVGGMGVVYGAFDPQLDRKVALKVMHPNTGGKASGTGGRSRLLREAQAMAKLSHPNVITVHDVGTFGERVFVAMEFVDGSTLREWLRQQHREWQEITEAFVKAGRGLAAAHAAGLVHRDFKPDNVLIGKDRRVLVMDFGLARIAGVPDRSRTATALKDIPNPRDIVLTRTGALLGTPAYMAPEQHKGSKPDPYADQFSFCVALYEALYGERPFAGNSVTSLAMNVLDGQLRSPPKNSGVPGWLLEVVVRGLETYPQDRWPSIDALLAELQRDPVDKRPPWIGIGVALGVGGLITIAYLASRPPVDDRCAALAERVNEVWDADTRARVTANLADSGLSHAETIAAAVDARLRLWTEQWTASYLEVCRTNVRPAPRGPDPSDVQGLVCLDIALVETRALAEGLATADALATAHAPQALERLPVPDDCVGGGELVPTDLHATGRQLKVRAELAAAHAAVLLGHGADALVITDGLASSARAMDDAGLHAHVLQVRALGHRAVGLLSDAENELELAVVLAGEAGMPRLESALWIELADLVGHVRDRRAEGLRLALAASAALARAETPPRLVARLHTVRGRIAAASGRYDEADAEFETALWLMARAGQQTGVTVAALLSAQGLAEEGLGRFEDAVETHSRAIQQRELFLGPGHSLVGRSLSHLGSATLGADFLAKADASFVRARWVLSPPAAAETATPIDPTSADGSIIIAGVQRNLADAEDRAGLLHRARESFGKAEASHRRALELLNNEVPADHRDLGYPNNNLGLALSDQQRHLEALTPLRRAVAIWSQALPRSHPDLAVAHLNVGNSLWAMSQFVEARLEYERALDVWERSLPPDHPLLAYALTGIGRCAVATEDYAAAIEHLEHAMAIRDTELEDRLNLAETALALAQALWANSQDPTRARVLAMRARDLVGAYEPSDPAGIERLLGGEHVPRLTDQLIPAGLGTTNRNPAPYR